MKTSALALACAFSLISHIGLAQVEIHIEASHTLRPYTPAWNYFGADEPNYTYAPNSLKLLKELSTLSPTPVYIRVHNLLTTGDGSSSLKWGSTNAYSEDAQGRPVYNWAITDRIFDAFRAAHVRPLVEIGFMPEALSAHPEPYRHSFPQGDIFTGWSYPPKDYAKWSALVTAYATHLHTRYGASVGTWLWEVWNEPDIAYWHGTPAEYDKLYDVTAAAILQALPNAKIGGPESTGPYGGKSEAFLRQFLEHCATGTNAATNAAGAPLDFISFPPKGAPRVVDSCALSTSACRQSRRSLSGSTRRLSSAKATRRAALRAASRRTRRTPTATARCMASASLKQLPAPTSSRNAMV
jgi:xylan 1,4-beta-xylosidase